MANALNAETRKLLTKYATASFDCGKIGSAELGIIAMLQGSREPLEKLKHSRRGLDSKAALTAQVTSLPETLKPRHSVLLEKTPRAMRAAEKRMAALINARARLTRELPTKGAAVSYEGRSL